MRSGIPIYQYYDIAKPVTFLPATTLVAPILVNRQFMKLLGPELEAIVREESRKAEVLFVNWTSTTSSATRKLGGGG